MTTPDTYPQELRNRWADTYAAYGTSIWKVVDSRTAHALMPTPENATLLREAEVQRDAARRIYLDALAAFRQAEDAYYEHHTESPQTPCP